MSGYVRGALEMWGEVHHSVKHMIVSEHCVKPLSGHAVLFANYLLKKKCLGFLFTQHLNLFGIRVVPVNSLKYQDN